MPFFMSLKYGTALCTSFAWLRTQTRTSRGALLGAFLYAFSGFQACNIVFQHFHEATAFFPLYLLALDHAHSAISRAGDKSAGKNPLSVKKGILGFVLMTSAMSVINYFFFFGQVLFLSVYYLIRYASNQKVRQTLKEILQLLLAGVLGLCLSAFFLVQVLDVISGNTRLDDFLLGYDMVAYSEPATPLAILKSFFMLPDLVGRGSLFTSEQIRNSSLSLFLPCFAVSGAIAYLRAHRKGWQRTMLLTCLVIAFVPILNAAFALFNSEYYARWFYMPILLLSLVTVRELEDADCVNLLFGARMVILADILFLLCAFLPTRPSEEAEGGISFLQIMEYPELFVTEAVVTAVMLPLLLVIVNGIEFTGKRPSSRERACCGLVTRTALALVILCCFLTQAGVLLNGNTIIAGSGGEKWRTQLLENRPEIPGYGNASFERIEADGTSTNYEMVWGYPTIHCFESTVSSGIFAFYQGIGPGRTVDSKLNFSHIGARAILSSHYYLENKLIRATKNYTKEGALPGYQKVGESDGYNIYENRYFIPVGFTFDRFMTEDTYALLLDRDKTAADRTLVRDLILDDEAAAKYGSLFSGQDTDIDEECLSSDSYYSECRKRASTACTSFTTSKSGFTAEATLDRENLVFFSFPFEKGWSARVDGKEAEIVKADFGLMAVCVPEGTHTIAFTYLPYGLHAGILVSFAALVILLAYFLLPSPLLFRSTVLR